MDSVPDMDDLLDKLEALEQSIDDDFISGTTNPAEPPHKDTGAVSCSMNLCDDSNRLNGSMMKQEIKCPPNQLHLQTNGKGEEVCCESSSLLMLDKEENSRLDTCKAESDTMNSAEVLLNDMNSGTTDLSIEKNWQSQQPNETGADDKRLDVHVAEKTGDGAPNEDESSTIEPIRRSMENQHAPSQNTVSQWKKNDSIRAEKRTQQKNYEQEQLKDADATEDKAEEASMEAEAEKLLPELLLEEINEPTEESALIAKLDAEECLPESLLDDINEVNQEVPEEASPLVDAANSVEKMELQNEECEQKVKIEDDLSGSKEINGPTEEELSHSVEKPKAETSTEVNAIKDPGDNKVVTKKTQESESAQSSLFEHSEPNADDLYDEIERMERLIEAEKQACNRDNPCPGSSPPIVCSNDIDDIMLCSSTVDKDTLTKEEKEFLGEGNQDIEEGEDAQLEQEHHMQETLSKPTTVPIVSSVQEEGKGDDVVGSVDCSSTGPTKCEAESDEVADKAEEVDQDAGDHMEDEGEATNQPSTSNVNSQPVPHGAERADDSANSSSFKRSVVASTHNFDISVINSEIKLTESELQLAKVKPYWIPDEECINCMLCSAKFTIVNRRHHCRSCGRVLCSGCCSARRTLPYLMETDQRKQRVCSPCNKTLDRIEEYEKFLAERNQVEAAEGQSSTSAQTEPSAIYSTDVNAPTPTITTTRKKSVLKVRLPSTTTDPSATTSTLTDAAAATASSTNAENQSASTTASNPTPSTGTPSTATPTLYLSTPIPTPSTGGGTSAASVLSTSLSVLNQPKRSVTFRDGVNPGDSPTGPAAGGGVDGAVSSEGGGQSKASKNPRKLSRRTMEKRAEEEQTSFLLHQPESLFLASPEAHFSRTSMTEVWEKIEAGVAQTIALKRNLWAVVQRVEVPSNGSPQSVLCYSTQGFNSIGVDELLLVVERRPNLIPSENEDEEALKAAQQAHLEEQQEDLVDVLLLLEDIFSKCLMPVEDTLDDRMGIRRCGRRMAKMYSVVRGQLAGIEASAVVFHRPQGQVFDGLPIPSTPFLIGSLLKKEEITWAIALPNRVLYSMGKQSSYYPVPLVNARQRPALFHPQHTQASVLKVFNDFRNWNYQMSRLPGSHLSLSDDKTQVIIPEWAVDEIKSIVETNRNMLGWALDFNDQADSHLVCEQNSESGVFQTHIFTRHGTERAETGATFVIFDGALKNSTELFVVSVVEDGVVIRMQADTMTELVKHLLNGDNFHSQSANMQLNVLFQPSSSPVHKTGALVSPIDGHNLMGKYQYGLVLSRQFRSQNFVPSASEWALRLGSVINMDRGKFPSVLQPKFFEICEQLVAGVTQTITPFIHLLVQHGIRAICLRVRVDDECAVYETEKWANIEDIHYVWTTALDEQIIPFLYSLCAWVPNGLHVELHMPIISTRPLPMGLNKNLGV